MEQVRAGGRPDRIDPGWRAHRYVAPAQLPCGPRRPCPLQGGVDVAGAVVPGSAGCRSGGGSAVPPGLTACRLPVAGLRPGGSGVCWHPHQAGLASFSDEPGSLVGAILAADGQERMVTTQNAPAANPPGTSTATPASAAPVPAPPSWPWRRGALILAGAAQLITISALTNPARRAASCRAAWSGLWGSRTRPLVLTWASTPLARTR